ncbi:hypothetical protein C0991_004797, partial [Blastosporella zonata]
MHYSAPSEPNPWDSSCRLHESLHSAQQTPINTPGVSHSHSRANARSQNSRPLSEPELYGELQQLNNAMASAALNEADEDCLRSAPKPEEPVHLRDLGRRKRKDAFVAYVVFSGHKTGIFQTWDAASFQLENYVGFARWKGYSTLQAAKEAWRFALANGTIGEHLPGPKQAPPCRRGSPLPSQCPDPSHSPTPHHLQPFEEEESITQLSRKKVLSPENCWYSVLQGDRPGVYLGA